MRTTIRLDDVLLAEAKEHALASRRSFNRLVRDALVAQIQRERGAASPRTVRLTVFKGDGVHDGIEINKSSDLLDRMELDDRTGPPAS